MFISAAFNAVVGAAHSAIEGLAALLTPAAGSFAVALAIVVFTLLVRLLISPLTYVQVRGERRRAALAPYLAELQKKHGADRTALATATMDLHREHGVSMFAGLLPGLAQAPFFMVMYRVAAHAPAGAVFGVPLTAHVVAGWPVFVVLLALAGAVAWWSARRMKAAAQPAGGATAGPLALMRYLPYFTVLMVAWLPLAGALYLVTSTAWTALEHAIWRRPVTTGNR